MSRRRPRRQPSRSPIGTLLIGALVVLGVVAVLAIRGGRSLGTAGTAGTAGTPTARPLAAAQPSATPQDGATPTPTPLVVPTPAIPLPRSCPANTAPQVNNPARYGFCTPVGWGAWNDNNSIPQTLIMDVRVGDSPIVVPSDFDRIKLLIALNVGAPSDQPADCKSAANDSIDGLATHHCEATLDPGRNPYHAVKAEYWTIDLFQNQKFYMTALIAADVTPDEEATMSQIVHNVKPTG